MAIKIIYINEKDSGIGYHRLQVPFANMDEDYKDLDIKGTNGFTLDFHPRQFDIVVLNRMYKHDEDYLLKAKESGCKIILDIDDWIQLPGYHHRDGVKDSIVEQRILDAISYADVIWTASEFLKECLKDYHDNIVYIPNGIDFKQPQFIPQRNKQDKYTIGWIGANNHQLDIRKLIEPFKKLLKNKNHKLIFGGYVHIPEEDRQFPKSPSYYEIIESYFTSNSQRPPDQYQRIEWMDIRNYALMYNLMDCALAPLNSDKFSLCKSNIKVLEAGAFSLPIICSNVAPYKEFIEQGLVLTPKGDWDGCMKSLISNPIKGIQLGAKLHEYVKENYNIKTVNKKRYDSIISLMA
jgi:processive 1,2-diacylglycerol beta-glucosyltransferase